MARRRWTNEEVAEYRKQHEGFYVNKEDTRILVPKAFGFGFTLNWGNPLSYVALAVLIAAVALIKIFVVKE